MFKRIYLTVFALTLLVLSVLLTASASAQGISIVSAGWQGNDFVIQFSDSISGNIDDAASDSSVVIVNFSQPIIAGEKQYDGPNGIVAALSRNAGDSIAVLTVRGTTRIGYSTLWRPYSHRLIVHTFNWDSLAYAPEQYHLGLLALEKKESLPQAKKYLSGATAFGDRRAASVLGVLYEREGEDSLATLYLKAPLDADDYMARANVNRRAGDVEAAERDEEHYQRKLAASGTLGTTAQPASTADESKSETGEKTSLSNLFDDGTGIALVILAALLIILLAVWFSRRPAKPAGQSTTESAAGPPPVPTHGSTIPSETQTTTAVEAPAEEEVHATATTGTPPQPETQSPITSSMQTPAIAPPIETESAEAAPSSATPATDEVPESVQLPQPDALPIEPEVQAPEVTKRKSSQAEQLLQRMEKAQSRETQTPTTKSPSPSSTDDDDESTLTEARRLHVSRDYVELRNRIAELRRRIDES